MPPVVQIRPPAELDAADAAPRYRARRHPRVTAQSQRGRNRWVGHALADWSSIVLRADSGDDTCTLAVDALRIGRVNRQHLAQLLDWLNPDRLVRVVAQWGSGGRTVLFQGYPQPVSVSWGPKSQTMRVTCISEAQEKLRTGHNQHVRGRMMLLDPLAFLAGDTGGGSSGQNSVDIVAVGAMPTTFNTGGRPNRTPYAIPAPQSTNGNPDAADEENAAAAAVGPIHAFLENDAPEAEYWTYAQALRYLVWHYIYTAGAVVDVSQFLTDTEPYAEQESTASDNPFVQRITPRVPEVSIESLNVDEALAMLCARAGLHYHLPIRTTNGEASFFLRVYAAVHTDAEAQATPADSLMGGPRVFDLPREPPFTDNTGRTAEEIAQANKVQASSITIDPRAVTRGIHRGGIRTYEVMLLLRPGWAPHVHLDNLHEAVVDPDTGIDPQETAKKFWLAEFEEEFSDLDGRVPTSIYHGMHVDHASVADVFRLWLFPDDTRSVGKGLGRDAAGVVNEEHIQPPLAALWPEARYSPYMSEEPDSSGEPPIPNPSLGLVYQDPIYGGALSHAIVGNWIPRRRPFLDTVSRRNPSLSDTSPIVRVNFVATSAQEAMADTENWVEFAGKVELDRARAAIRFVDPNMWGSTPFMAVPGGDVVVDSAIARFIEGRFWVSVTCTIQSDERMERTETKQRTHFTRPRTQVIDYGFDTHQLRDREAGNSHLKDQADDPAYSTRDDTERMAETAVRDIDRLSVTTTSGDPEIFWLDDTIQLGDVFSGVAGLGIEFPANPIVTGLEYINAGGTCRTKVHLTDLRHSPEVGDE